MQNAECKATLKPKDACGAALRRGSMGAMPDLMETPSDVILTPHGLLLVENAPPPSPWLEAETGRRVAAAFAESAARGLLHLGAGGEIPGLRAQLRPYQAVGVDWLWFPARLGLGAASPRGEGEWSPVGRPTQSAWTFREPDFRAPFPRGEGRGDGERADQTARARTRITAPCKEQRGLAHSKTLPRSPLRQKTRSVLDCGSPLPL